MKGRPRTGEVEDLGVRGSWRFTRELVVEPELVLVFHELYEAAFGALRVRSMARQVLTEDEFGEQMRNPAIHKYVAWTAADEPVGMCAVTADLTTVPWISPEYFAACFPEQWKRRGVWYFNFLLAHPSQRHGRFLDHIIDVGIGALIEQQVVCAYDMCAYNDVELGLGGRVRQSFERTTGVRPELADAQSYFTLDLSVPGADRIAPVPNGPAGPVPGSAAGTL